MRKKPCIILLLILILVAAGAWLVIQQIGGNLRSTEAYQMAMERIRNYPELREQLGQPITDSWRTAGRFEEHEVDMLFTIYGPKGQAKVHVHGKPIMGKWELDILDVTVEPSGNTLKLLQDEGGAPLFQASQPIETSKPQDNTHAPEINLTPPGDVPGQP